MKNSVVSPRATNPIPTRNMKKLNVQYPSGIIMIPKVISPVAIVSAPFMLDELTGLGFSRFQEPRLGTENASHVPSLHREKRVL
jgi:hypothetical protein